MVQGLWYPNIERRVIQISFPYLQLDAGPGEMDGILMWDDLLIEGGELFFEQVPFDHPLWVVYSSGTTGLPKGLARKFCRVSRWKKPLISIPWETRRPLIILCAWRMN